jgi:hypothetical protein
MNRPQRGEIWIVDLGYAAKIRPAAVLSVPIIDEDRILAAIVPHTTSVQNTRFEVNVSRPFLKSGPEYLTYKVCELSRVVSSSGASDNSRHQSCN